MVVFLLKINSKATGYSSVVECLPSWGLIPSSKTKQKSLHMKIDREERVKQSKWQDADIKADIPLLLICEIQIRNKSDRKPHRELLRKTNREGRMEQEKVMEEVWTWAIYLGHGYMNVIMKPMLFVQPVCFISKRILLRTI